MLFKMETIQELLNTGIATEGSLLIVKKIYDTLIEETEKALLPRSEAAIVFGPAQIPGSSIDIDLATANTMDVRVVAEGAEIPLDNADYTSTNLKPVKYGVAIRITREMIEDSQFDLKSINLATAGRRFAENETNLVLGQLDNAANTVAGGSQVTLANVAEAIFNVEDGEDYMPSDYLIGNEVHQDLMNIDTFVDANKAGNTELMSRGYVGTIFGLNVARYSTNAGVNAVATSSYVFDRKMPMVLLSQETSRLKMLRFLHLIWKEQY